MAKEAAITVRVPAALKQRLEARAKRERRSVSAQVVVELERGLADEAASSAPGHAVLGMFEGARVPTDDEFAEVRAAVWRRLGHRG
jgi:hypothetical protein